MMDEWYNYGIFRHTKEQTLWALRNWSFFEEGVWPPEPPEYLTDEYSKETKKWVKVFKKKSTAIDAPISKRRARADAYFTKPKNIAGEISLRLKRTKTDGKLLRAQVKSEELELAPEAYDALMFIKGWRRKRQSFAQWKAEGRRLKTHKIYGFAKKERASPK